LKLHVPENSSFAVPLAVFGGRARLVMAHLVESGELTLQDIREAEKALRKSSGKDKLQ
jgi:BlaI family penicillinase repressor